MKKTLDIMFEGVPLTVVGEYTKGIDSIITADPYTSVEGVSAQFIVTSVYIETIDCTTLLDFCLGDIAEKAISELTN